MTKTTLNSGEHGTQQGKYAELREAILLSVKHISSVRTALLLLKTCAKYVAAVRGEMSVSRRGPALRRVR